METVERFEKVVENINNYCNLDCKVYYDHGHILEINNTLVEKENSPTFYNKKYPLIMLLQPFTEGLGDGRVSISDLRIIICTNTESDIKANERYKKTFKPTLIPIYDLFINELIESGLFLFSDELRPSHNRIDRPFYGISSNNGTVRYVMSDELDAIEITNLNVNYIKDKCDNKC
jgi:hypothetical protein